MSHLIFSLISSQYFLVFTSHLVSYHFSSLISSFLILLPLLTSSSCLLLFCHSSSILSRLSCFFFVCVQFLISSFVASYLISNAFSSLLFFSHIISSFSSCFSFPVFTSHLVSLRFVTALFFQSHLK